MSGWLAFGLTVLAVQLGFVALTLVLPGSRVGLLEAWGLALAGAVQPLSVGAATVEAAWALLAAGPADAVAASTLTALVAVNLLPFPPQALGEAMLVVAPSAARDRLRVVGVLVQVGFALGWLVALGAAGWR